jgi:hypothetical protein
MQPRVANNAGAETRETRQRLPVDSPATCYAFLDQISANRFDEFWEFLLKIIVKYANITRELRYSCFQ